MRLRDINLKLSSPELVNIENILMGLPTFVELIYQGAQVFNNGDVLWNSDTARALSRLSMEQWLEVHSSGWHLGSAGLTREFMYIFETCTFLDSPSLAPLSA